MSKAFKWFVWMIASTALILVLCGIYLVGRDYSGYFNNEKGKLTRTRITTFRTDSLFKRQWLAVENDRGMTVECGLLTPSHAEESIRYPVVILMGGKATGKHAIDYALDIRNVIIVAPDYSYTPRESYSPFEFLADIPEMRRAALNMVPSVMLVTDYLMQRPDVDTTKLILLGYSFGAPFVPCIAANDRRAAAVAMVFGGGDLRGMIRHNVRRYRGAVEAEIAGDLGKVLLYPLEPLRYADRISPIPLIMINGSKDEQVPQRYAREFFDKAGEPKKLVWLEARHVNPRNVELTKRIVATLKQELTDMNLLTRGN